MDGTLFIATIITGHLAIMKTDMNRIGHIIVVVDPYAGVSQAAVDKASVLARRLDASVELLICDIETAHEDDLIRVARREPAPTSSEFFFVHVIDSIDMDAAVEHCNKGVGIWDWASTDANQEPDVVMACAGDVPTMEALAAVALLKEHFPTLKMRFVNVVDLFRLMPESEHPHGLSDRDFDSLFTKDKPVIFNFHSYASLIHKLAYRRTNHANFHVRGYKEKGNINTPLELAIINQIDRYNLAIDVIDRVPRLQESAAHIKDRLKDPIIEHLAYAHAEGIDNTQIRNWQWPSAMNDL
jgi:XFP C-terminal domain